ncbi:glycosyltransferase [Empedobacter falsenii]
MKKIIILIPDISKSGGTERATINLANMLVKDYEIEIISFHNLQNAVTTFYDLDSRVKLISFKLSLKSTMLNSIVNYISLRNYLKQTNFNFLIGTWYGANIMLPFFKSKNVKVIGCEHADFENSPSIIKKIAKKLYPKLDALVVLSDVAKQKMLCYTSKTVVIPNSLPFVAKETSSLENNRILMLGRLVPVKAYERVIPLGIYLHQEYPDWKIDIFGDGDLRDDLIQKIKQHNLNNINIYQATKNIEKEYLNSSIYLSTSITEAMPMVFLEAMSCGVPVISYYNEGAACLISENQDGIMVNNEEELKSAIKNLIDNVTLRKSLGIKGKEKSLYYTEENIKKLWLKLLNGL